MQFECLTFARSRLTVGEQWHVQLLDTPAHRLTVWQCLDKHGIDTNSLELLGSRHGLFPSVDQGVGSRKNENVVPLVSCVAGRLDPSVGLASRNHRLALRVSTPCPHPVSNSHTERSIAGTYASATSGPRS